MRCPICHTKPTTITRDGGSFTCCGHTWHDCKDYGTVMKGHAHPGHTHRKTTSVPYMECPTCAKGSGNLLRDGKTFTCCDRDWHYSQRDSMVKRGKAREE